MAECTPTDQEIASWLRTDPERGLTALLHHHGAAIRNGVLAVFPGRHDLVECALTDLTCLLWLDPGR